MNKDLETRILNCGTLPTPPVVAARIVEQCRRADNQVGDIARIVSDDPAISLKLIKLANSAAYRGNDPCSSVSQAVTRLGINVSSMTALSFSLSNTLKSQTRSALDYDYLWRRAVTSAAVARFLAQRAELDNWEECFLAALVQDVGMIAADHALHGIYEGISNYDQHESAQLSERQQLDVDHAAVGARLLRHWGLPERIVSAVEQSHSLAVLTGRNKKIDSTWCVAYSGILADAILLGDRLELARSIALSRSALGKCSGPSDCEFGEALYTAVSDAETLFDARLLPNPAELVDMSKTLMFDYMVSHNEREQEFRSVASLQAKVEQLEEENRRDALTGAYNRQYFDRILDAMIAECDRKGCPISLMFIDVDRFKQINDRHGHQVGDEVLKWLASALHEVVRDTDVVARYGGEEFVVILPTLGEEHAGALGNRIVEQMNDGVIQVGELQLEVTVSIGIAAANGAASLSSRELVVVADQAMYFAKKTGRNKCSRASKLPEVLIDSE